MKWPFSNDPFQSNRARNWFNVDWLLYNLRYDHEFDTKKSLSVSFFGLNAVRNALGFRVNRVDQVDSNGPRDLISGDFNNFGLESKFLNNYKTSLPLDPVIDPASSNIYLETNRNKMTRKLSIQEILKCPRLSERVYFSYEDL